MNRPIRIATRSSPLALWQARFVAKQIQQLHPGRSCQIIPITANADKDLKTPLYSMGAVGVFAKEVHQYVLSDLADIGVHSCKDLPTQSPQGICIGAILKRHDPRDVFISQLSPNDLPNQAVIGTSSLRRRYQLAALWPQLQFENIRGNVGTRLSKIDNGDYHATLMAVAGLKRLQIQKEISYFYLDPITECIPAPAQGALAIDHLESRKDIAHLIKRLNHHDSMQAVMIERSVLQGLQGGCSLPLGCYVRKHELRWELHAVLANEDGTLKRVHLIDTRHDITKRALDQLLD